MHQRSNLAIPGAVFLLVSVLGSPAPAWADESAVWTASSHAAVSAAFVQQQSPQQEPQQPPAPSQKPATPDDTPPPPSQPATGPAQASGPQPHPAPAHTGFAALAKDTVSDFVAFPKRRSTWVILGIGAGLAALSHPLDDDVNHELVGSEGVHKFFVPGRVIGASYTQIGVSLGLYAIGRWVVPRAEGEPRTNKLSHLGFDLLRAQALSQAVVQGVKYTVQRDRPTGECCSFPSGHAATAFAVASVLERHLGYRLAWPTLVGATYVAASRLHDNRHFLSDVLFGAGVGTATGWTVVGRHGRESYAFLPTPVPGGVALMLTRVGDEHHGG